MKIKLSKSQWETIGKTAGWMKKAEATKMCTKCKKKPVWGKYGEYARCEQCCGDDADAGERASEGRGGDPPSN